MSTKIKDQCTMLPVGASLAIITKYYYGALSKMLEDVQLERHFTTLVLIHKTKGKCTQQYLSDMLSVDKVYMVHILDYLDKKQLISRSVNPSDRREHLIALTAKGKAMVPKIENAISKLNKIAFDSVKKEDQDTFWCCIQEMMKNLRSLPANTVDIKIKK